jgi:cell division protein FtsB
MNSNRKIESMSTGFWGTVKTLKPSHIFIVVLLGLLAYTLINGGFNYLTEQSKNKLKQELATEIVQLQEENRRIKESITRDRQIREQNQSRINVDKLYELMDEIERNIPSANSISIYYIHDSGGVPKSGVPLKATVLYEKRDKEVPSLKKYWKSEPIPEGFFYYNKFIYDYGEKYVSDVTQEKKIYVEETIELLSRYKTKAMYGVFIEQSTAGTYYLNFGFPKTDPFEEDRYIKYRVLEYAKRIRPLLQVAEASILN